jgi:hypothetical protein
MTKPNQTVANSRTRDLQCADDFSSDCLLAIGNGR